MAGGAAAVPASALAKPIEANRATAESAPDSGYRVTAHVKAFYKSALGPR
jgi:hypothetical protein